MSDGAVRAFVGEALALIEEMRTAHLATVDPAGVPLASVAPFVRHTGAVHVYVSALAAHTANLRATGRVSVLIARDEVGSPDPFARARLTIECSAEALSRGAAQWHSVMDLFEARFGETAATVRGLGDFALFRLAPHAARMVAGFGRARSLGESELAVLFPP